MNMQNDYNNLYSDGYHDVTPYDAETRIAEDKELASFLATAVTELAAEWTYETTVERRNIWNVWVSSLTDKITAADVAKKQKEFGWTLSDLRDAKEINNIK